MPTKIDISRAVKSDLPIIDVRSPAEYEKGHIPKAVNIPLFTNQERAQIGTVYKQESAAAAIALGTRLVQPKLQHFVKRSFEVAPQGRTIVHCWRGGMRSEGFANHIGSHGFNEVLVIEKGYKAFRRLALKQFSQPYNLFILGGFTGSGKTEILKGLAEKNLQVIDLEGLARHKGSAFGALGNTKQPTVEQFENELFTELMNINPHKPLWLEDESHNIGKVKIPDGLFQQISNAPLLFLDIPKEERARFLAQAYAQSGSLQLAESMKRISKRLGGLRTQQALDYLEKQDYYQAALIALQYYDKYYEKGLENHPPDQVKRLPLYTTKHLQNAQYILKNTTIPWKK